MIFQRLLSARNCPVPLIILGIKIGLLCNFAKKKLRAALLWDKAAQF